MDSFKQIGKYLREGKRKSDFQMKRPMPPQKSIERIRDVFDSENPFSGAIVTPAANKHVLLDVNFGRKLPSLGCCADCMCGITESYTSDSLVSGSIYVTTPYVPESTVVFLDGVQKTRGVHYTEANPATGQIAVLEDFSIIVISYVYTVGNCTEAICIDERFECLGYTFLSGLVTVFSDRFDRPAESDPSGGCGYYFSTALAARPKTFPIIIDGEAIISSTTATWIGGVDRLVGKSVEVLAAVNVDSMSTGVSVGNAIVLNNHEYSTSFQLIKNSDTVLTLKVNGFMRQYMVFDDPFSSIDLTSFNEGSFSVETTITNEGGRYWFRVAQLNGSWVAKAWPQFTTEPGTQVTLLLSDSFADVPIDTTEPNIEIDRELIQPTVNYIRFPGAGWEAIQVGAGLDNGDWEQGPTAAGPESESAHGHYCAEIPDGLVRFGYNCFPFNGGSEVIYGNNSLETEWIYSYPHDEFAAGDGTLGRVVEYSQHIISIKTGLNVGHPGGVRLKGQISGSVWTNPVTAQIIQYPTGPLTMGGINGIQGGTVLASFLVGTDGTQKQDVDIFIPTSPGEEYVRVGIHIPNLSQLAMQQPFFHAPFLSANNVTSVVFFYFLRAEAVQSVQCNAAPFCNDCANNRCPPVEDNFTTDTGTRDFGTTDFYRTPNSGLKVFHDKGTGSKVEYIDGTEKVSFNNSATALQSSQYASPFDCSYTEDTTSAWEATFDVRLTTPAAAEATSFEFGGWGGGPYIRTQWDSGGIDFVGSFNMSPSYSSTNLTLGPWYSIKYRLEGLNFFLKIWLAGTTEPSAWDFTSTATSHTQTFATYTDATWASGTSSFTSEIRNVVINKVV